MVRQLMMRIGDAELRVRPRALLTAVHERDHARQIALKRQHLQVVKQPHVLVERIGNADRPIDFGQLSRALFLGLLDPPLDVAQRLEIVAHFRVVGRAEPLLKLPHARGHRIENAAVLAETRCAHARIGAVARPEQPLEHDARIVFRHQRQGRRQPRQRVAVRAAVARIAGSHQVVVVDGELQRRQLRLALERSRRNLVHRDGVPDDAVGLLDVHAGQIRSGRARVVAAAVAERFRLTIGEPGDDNHAIAERLRAARARARTRSRRRRLSAASSRRRLRSGDRRRPDGVRLWPASSATAVSAGIIASSSGRRDSRADAAKHGAPGNRFLGHNHDGLISVG